MDSPDFPAAEETVITLLVAWPSSLNNWSNTLSVELDPVAQVAAYPPLVKLVIWACDVRPDRTVLLTLPSRLVL